MFVCASTDSFPHLPREEIFPQLVDLEFTAVELPIHETGRGLVKPSAVLENVEVAGNACRETSRLTVSALSIDQTEGESADADLAAADKYYERFAACCKLAKSLKVVPLVVPAAELGTPFNAEIERLRELVRIASFESCLVALRTEIGCMTEDPATATVLCDNVKGLGLALDPSHYVTGPWQGRDIAKVMPYVYHVRLRDSTKTEFNVRVGQGEIDYGKLLSQLSHEGYDRALTIHMPPIDGQDHRAELRKLRLLLESLL